MGAGLVAPSLLLTGFLISLALTLAIAIGSAATPKLQNEEVEALREIAKKLGKKDWDFKKDPCSGEGNWIIGSQHLGKGSESNVTCQCNTTSCHVLSIALKAQNLSGVVPEEFAKLHYLKHLDLSRNLLKGFIPPLLASMRLEDLSFMGNMLSGPFPIVLTRITSLKNLSIEGNRFTGTLPQEIGRLINLQKLILSSNDFDGTLPLGLAKLTNLDDLRINDNNFSGKIPTFISSWTKIQKLHIQGSSLEGPIPSNISALTNLTDLRISDLKGNGSVFPPLDQMESIKTLILRRCLLHGKIPDYIGQMKRLKNLDLSYNSLSGGIPKSFENPKADFIYLTGNKLSGPIPQWLQRRNKNVDASFNNFTWENSSPVQCPQGSVNLVESYSGSANKLKGVLPCLKQNFPCLASRSQERYSLHINCGGKEMKIGDTKYEADMEQRGASTFYMGQNWALSSTGNFMDNDLDSDSYIVENDSALPKVTGQDKDLYMTARLSAVSLMYYGLCLMDGNYTVRLHFAEIIFAGNGTRAFLGKRIFDVYIQGKLVLKNFNIAKEAGGPGRPIVKNFTTVVTRRTLKIQFYWAGKGTTGIPLRGVYGPLISAISVDPNFKPPPPDEHKKNYALLVAVLVSAALVGVFLTLLVWRKYFWGKTSAENDLKGIDLQTGIFTLKQMKAATDNFDAANKIGEGGFGSVFKGLLPDGTIIAVKQLSSKSKQGNREFVNEIGMISALQHPNLVKLYGCCVEGNQLLLIYEYMENNCLSRALFGRNGTSNLKLDWSTRQKICLGIARGLAYLHEESRIKIVHRDIKTSNVLLDKDLNSKISDFGLAKLTEDDNTHISTRIAGTIGYMAPEYAMRGHLTNKADVYSFGVVALEIVSGKSNTNYRPQEEFVYLLDWAYVLQERGSLLELVDPALGSEFCTEEAMVMLNVALMCTNAAPTLRPTMSQVVSMLEGRTAVQDLLADPGFSAINSKLKAIRNHFWQNPSQNHSMSTSWPDSSSTLSNIEMEGNEHLISFNSVV